MAISTFLDSIVTLLAAVPGMRPPLRPADPKVVASIERLVAGRLHPDVATFLRSCGNADAALAVEDGVDWLGTKYALSTLRELRRVEGFPSKLIPISTDGAGNYACVDSASGAMKDWDHETCKATALAPNLERYLTTKVVAPGKRAIADRAGIEKLRSSSAPIVHETESSAPVTKLRRVPRPDLVKVDRPGYAGGARSAALLADARLLVGFQNTTLLWDLAGAKQLAHTFESSDALGVHAATGRVVAAHGDRLTILSLPDLAAEASFTANDGRIWDVAVSPAGDVAISCGEGGVVRAWDIARRRGLPSKPPPSKWETEKGKPIFELHGHEGITSFCRFSRDGGRVLSGGRGDHAAVLWDFRLRKEIARWKAKESLWCGAFQPDGDGAAVGVEGGEVALLDRDGKLVRRWQAHSYDVRAVAFISPNELLSCTSGEIALWNLDAKKARFREKVPRGNLRSLHVASRMLLTVNPLAIYELR